VLTLNGHTHPVFSRLKMSDDEPILIRKSSQYQRNPELESSSEEDEQPASIRDVSDFYSSVEKQKKSLDRDIAHSISKEKVEEYENDLPKRFGNITVESFGSINPGTNFHNRARLYPVGYQCELHLESKSLRCEIVELDNQLEFLLTLPNGETSMASSEPEILKKVRLSDSSITFSK
jgi:hypothetical protein